MSDAQQLARRLRRQKIAAPTMSAAIMFIGSIQHPHDYTDGNEGALLCPRRAGKTEAAAPISLIGRDTATT